MNSREILHDTLKNICPNVYYQPPPATLMKYPCIIYKRDTPTRRLADNIPYVVEDNYTLTVITSTIDDELLTTFMDDMKYTEKPMYCKDGLYHYIFTTKILRHKEKL